MTKFENVPALMRACSHWVLWRKETRDGRPTKVPYQPHQPRAMARSDTPATWGTFEVARAAAGQGFDGIGFMAGPEPENWLLIDLDHCTVDGKVQPWAQQIVGAANSFTEVSPSGDGLHIFANGEMLDSAIKTPSAEIYTQRRYFTVTGDIYQNRKDLRTLSAEEIVQIRTLILATKQTTAPAATTSPTGTSTVEPGSRHDHLVKVAASLARSGASPEAITKALTAENQSFTQPKSQTEIDKIASWAVEHRTDPTASPEPTTAATISRPSEYLPQVEHFYTHGRQAGLSTGWAAIDKVFTMVPGMLYVVTGYPGSGKTEFVLDLSMHMAMRYGWGWSLFSPENYPPESILQNLTEKHKSRSFFGSERMPFTEVSESLKFIDTKYSLLGVNDESVTLDMLLCAVLDLKHNGFILDPWNELEHARPAAMTQTEFIGQALTKLRRFARKHNQAIIVTAHPAKMRRDNNGEFPIPDLYDISDSAHWRNKVDFGIVVHRNEATGQTDLHVKKCRFKYYGMLGMQSLNFHLPTGTFRDAPLVSASGWDDPVVAKTNPILNRKDLS